MEFFSLCTKYSNLCNSFAFHGKDGAEAKQSLRDRHRALEVDVTIREAEAQVA